MARQDGRNRTRYWLDRERRGLSLWVRPVAALPGRGGAGARLLCGTAVEVAPVLEVDRRPVGDGEPGTRTLALQRLLRQIARREIGQHAEWTTPGYQTAEVGR